MTPQHTGRPEEPITPAGRLFMGLRHRDTPTSDEGVAARARDLHAVCLIEQEAVFVAAARLTGDAVREASAHDLDPDDIADFLRDYILAATLPRAREPGSGG